MPATRMRAPTKLAWTMPDLFTFLAFSAWVGEEGECSGGRGGGGADGTSSTFLCCDGVRNGKQGERCRGGGGTFMAICHLALIFFHPSTCSAHEVAQSACSAHAVRM